MQINHNRFQRHFLGFFFFVFQMDHLEQKSYYEGKRKQKTSLTLSKVGVVVIHPSVILVRLSASANHKPMIVVYMCECIYKNIHIYLWPLMLELEKNAASLTHDTN